MEIKQGVGLQTLKEIQKFLDQQPKLKGISETGARKRLDQLITQLTDSASLQSGSDIAAKSATQNVRTLTAELFEHHLDPIARIARAEQAAIPEIAPLGRPRNRARGERLVAVARGVAVEATKFKEAFVKAGMPEDFVGQLQAAADALAAALTERKQRQGDRGAATKLLSKYLTSAGKTVSVLDNFVRRSAKYDPDLLDSWKIVKRKNRSGVPGALPKPEGTSPFDATGGAE